jgi:hypothetical protein
MAAACQTIAGLDDKTGANDAGTGADASADAPGFADSPTPVDAPGSVDAPSSNDANPSTCLPLDFMPDAASPNCSPWDGGRGDGGVCTPADVGGFQPSWKPPTALHQAKCTQQGINDFHIFCLGGGDQAACQSFLATAAGKACAACIVTPATAASFGPLVDHSGEGYVSINVAGCVAALEPCNESCARDMLAADQCKDTACSSCKVIDSQSLAERNACSDWSASCGGCRDYGRRAACKDMLVGDMHPAAVCNSKNTFDELYATIVPLFCGP